MSKTISIQVDKTKSCGVLEHSWRYVGYDECNYTYIPEGVELLKKFSDLEKEPYFFRTHFMFCTGNCHGTYKFGSTNLYSEDKDGNPIYNYEIYDMIIDAYLKANTKPFIELGFMPMDLVDTNYLPPVKGGWQQYGQYKEVGWTCPPKDYDKWHGLIENLMNHLCEKYGRDEVKTWYFELWNEPDIFYWNGTAMEYCKLYDYTEHAVHQVLPEAYLAGPAVTGMFEGDLAQKFFNSFLLHCREGANFCTGEKGTRLDYVTFHVKGGGFPFAVHAEKAVPSVASLVHQVKVGLDSLKEYGYGDVEVVLSEADPDGWAAGGIYDNTNMVFRNTEYYATYVASTYNQIEKLSETYGMKIRPLAWAFFFPGERCFEGTRTFSTQGINKAVFNMFKIYGKLGHEKLAFESDGAFVLDFVKEPIIGHLTNVSEFDGTSERTDVSGFAVKGENGETQIVVYSHHDDRDVQETNKIKLTVKGYGDQKGLEVEHYRIDDEHSNAHTEWIRQGKPWYPTPEQYDAIKAREDLEKYAENSKVDSVGDQAVLEFDLPTHGVSLITIR